jgi:hypothetical protein
MLGMGAGKLATMANPNSATAQIAAKAFAAKALTNQAFPKLGLAALPVVGWSIFASQLAEMGQSFLSGKSREQLRGEEVAKTTAAANDFWSMLGNPSGWGKSEQNITVYNDFNPANAPNTNGGYAMNNSLAPV